MPMHFLKKDISMISNNAKRLSSSKHLIKSQNIGDNGQRRYYESCKVAKINIKKTSREKDMGHVDFIINGNQTVDVKGIKDSHKQGMVVLEIKNVQGKDGWCSEIGPEWIAFDFGAFFLHAKTKNLIEVVKQKCNLKKKVTKAMESLYCGYTRRDRQDLITMIKLSDILETKDYWFLPVEEYKEPMDLL
jgi:hypothetical protein